MQITEFLSKKVINIYFRKQATFFMSFGNRKCLFNSSNFVSRIKSIFSPTSFVNSFSTNFRDVPFWKSSNSFSSTMWSSSFTISGGTSPRVDRGVGSLQPIHTILGLTLNYHVFPNTVAFHNSYPNQPYTSHALTLSLAQRALLFDSRNSLYD